MPPYPPRETYSSSPYLPNQVDASDLGKIQDANYSNYYAPPPHPHAPAPPVLGPKGNAVSTRPPAVNENYNFPPYDPRSSQYLVKSMSPTEYPFPGMVMGGPPPGPPLNNFRGIPSPYTVGGMNHIPPTHHPSAYHGGGYIPGEHFNPVNDEPTSKLPPRKYKTNKETKSQEVKKANEETITSETDKKQSKLSTETLINEVGPILGGNINQVKDDFEAKFINNIATVLGKHKRGRPSLKEKAKSKEERDLDLAKKIRVEVYGDTEKRPKTEEGQSEGNELDPTMTQTYENESIGSEGTRNEDENGLPHTEKKSRVDDYTYRPHSTLHSPNIYAPYDLAHPDGYNGAENMRSTLDKLAANRKKAAISARKKRAEHKEFVMKLTEQVILLRKQNNQLEGKINALTKENQELRKLHTTDKVQDGSKQEVTKTDGAEVEKESKNSLDTGEGKTNRDAKKVENKGKN